MNKENLEKIFNDDLGTSLFPLLAEIYFEEGDYKRAQKVLNAGLLLNPNNNDGKFIQAKIAMINSDTKIAIKLLKDIIKSDGLYINAMKMLVLYYQSSGTNHASMIRILHQILDLLPDDEFSNDIIKTIKKKSPTSKKRKDVTKVKSRKPSTIQSKKNKKTPLKSSTADSSKQKNLNINPKMATLTFVDILIKQQQYSQANNVLKVISKNKSISKDSITQRAARIKKGLTKE